MKITTVATYAFCVAAAAFLMRVELHTDDAGVVAFLILTATFLLGCMRPRRAWQWALLVGPCVPAADLLFRTPQPPQGGIGSLALLTGFVIALGFAGSYSGVLARRIVRSLSVPDTGDRA